MIFTYVRGPRLHNSSTSSRDTRRRSAEPFIFPKDQNRLHLSRGIELSTPIPTSDETRGIATITSEFFHRPCERKSNLYRRFTFVIMVHVPSLLVGATSSLVAFLAVHEQLDHRSRLSAKWKLTGEAAGREGSLVGRSSNYNLAIFSPASSRTINP
jgi:hypothetical protein